MNVNICNTEQATKDVAIKLADFIFENKQPHTFINLIGNLGSGKTTFARYFIEQWLYLNQEMVEKILGTSPTFSLVRIYGKKLPLAHLDLYRLENSDELAQIDYVSYFYEYPVCLVEWLLKIDPHQKLKPKNSIDIYFEFIDDHTRKITY